MRWIVGGSLRFRYVVVALAAALIFFGIQQVGKQKLDAFPEFAPTQVQVQTEATGLSASEVEQLITVPLENAMNGLPRVETVRSQSVPQLSSIVLIFKRGTSLIKAREAAQERLQTVAPTLPSWAAPPTMVPPVSVTSRVMQIGVTSTHRSRLDLSLSAFWNIRARLLRVSGVANVAIWGERLKELQVYADPARMRAQRVTLGDLMGVTSGALDAGILQFTNGTQPAAGGYLDTARQRIAVQNSLPVATPKQLGQLPVADRGGKPLRIDQVARTAWGTPPLIGDAVVNGGPGLFLVVEKYPGANTLDVTRGVDRAIDELRPGLPGIHLDTHIFRPASFIESALHNLRVALIIGCILVIFVLIAFLFEWRAAFISLVSIPLSVIAALVILDLRVARGAHRDPLRDADQRGRGRARDPVRRALWRVLPAACTLIRAGGAGVDGCGAHRHAGTEPDPARPDSAAQGAAARALAEGALRGDARARRREPAANRARIRHGRRGRDRGLAKHR